MSLTSNQEEYAKLNSEQRIAVDAIEGPVMVLAGPGTGKTKILTLRIAKILEKTNVTPENILAITFTEAGAANMRRRLVAEIGAAGYYIRIGTFHGFCNYLIQEFEEFFPHVIGSRNILDTERISFVKEILDQGAFSRLKPFGDPYFYIFEILRSIRNIKSEGIEPSKFEKMVKIWRGEFESRTDKFHEKGAHQGKIKSEYEKENREIEKNEELVDIYKKYEKGLLEQKVYDYEDMLLLVIRSLESNEELLRELQETYQYILVDEHQDTNGAQNRILELLVTGEEHPNLFIVGDEKQAIFRFQGANLDNFLYFKDRFKNALLISLKHNYRSSQIILDSSQSLIEKNKSVLGSPLESTSERGSEKIKVIKAETSESELQFIAEQVKFELKDGKKPEEIAILFRENSDAHPLSRCLERNDIPFAIESEEDLLSDSDIRKVLILLETIASFGDGEKLAACLHIDFLEIEPLDIYYALRISEERRVSLALVLREAKKLEKSGIAEPEKLENVYKLLVRLKKWSKNVSLTQFFERLIHDSGLLNYYAKSEGFLKKLEKINILFEEAKKLERESPECSLEDFLRHIKILKEHRLPLKAKKVSSEKAVRLMTIHKAKGLEFEVIFIVGAVDGKYGNKRKPSLIKLPIKTSVDIGVLEKNEDERRLFYVALTRAKEKVFITYSEKNAEGREQIASLFISELKDSLIETVNVAQSESNKISTWLKTNKSDKEEQKDLAEFARKMLELRGLSVTALNNYLLCPWRYFYDNLVRIPKAKSKHQMYGTAVHAALKSYFDMSVEKGTTNVEYLLDKFDFYVKKEMRGSKDYEVVRSRGLRILTDYHKRYVAEWHSKTLNEYRITILLKSNVKLTGSLDKLELENNGRDVVVVDYKVKQPESRNWIQGKTENSDGNYYRQLIFYKLLLEHSSPKRFNMTAGVIDFVEPNERGVFKKEMFEIADNEVKDLETLTLKTWEEISNLSFYERRCEDKKCEYCALQNMRKSIDG